MTQNEPTRSTRTAMEDFARSLGVTGDAVRAFGDTWLDSMRKLNMGPQAELKWRLNQLANGRDPGQPVNWRGTRGLVLP